MIFSNYPHKLVSHSNQKYFFLEIGKMGTQNRTLKIFSKKYFEIEPGLNTYLNLSFSLYGNIELKESVDDWHETHDKDWNIPEHLFLLLTSNIHCVKANVSKNSFGIIQTLREDALSSFKLYDHGYETFTSKRSITGVIMSGIYEVKTSKFLIVKIVPPGHQTSPEEYPLKYLFIHSNSVQTVEESEVKTVLEKYGFSHSMRFYDWATI